MPVTVTKDRVDEVVKLIRDLSKTRLLIGIPAEDAGRTPEPGQTEAPSNAVLGYLNEFGEPEKNIPARPHLLPAVESVMPRVIPRLKKAGEAALSGDKNAIDTAFDQIGAIAVGAVQEKISDGPFVKLSPRTLAARRARGVTRESPLIDTGQLRRAYTYVTRRKGQ